MRKCLLIYLWIYIGLFYMIEAGDDDEHVHIKLHMTSGQRKRAQIQQHAHQHHKKRHANPYQHPRSHQQHSHPLSPPVATTTTNLYHDSPHNYLTGITATSSSTLLPQNHVFQSAHIKKFPSSTPLNLHESGQLLNIEEDVFGQGDIVGDTAVVSIDTVDGEPMTIPSYMKKNFASFPQPTTTYETEIIPHNNEGFNAVGESLDGLEDMDEDNEITASVGRGKGSLESLLLAEQQMENYQHHHHHHHHKPSLSPKSIKNEQLLQQLLQHQQNEQPEIMNTAAYKSARLRDNKYKAEKDYHSEDDMTEAMMYSSSVGGTRHNPAQSFNRPAEDETTNSGSIKPLTVDDIWSQLQQQYLSKYSPQAQPLASADSDEHQSLAPTTAIKTKTKRKRNTKRQRHAKPSTTTSWPAETLSYANNGHHRTHYIQPIKQLQQQQHYYDDLHSPPSASAFSGISLSAHRDSDVFVRRPFNKFDTHNDEEELVETDEERVIEFGAGGDDDEDDDDFDAYGDETFEEAIYQRGKKYTGHTAYGQQHGHSSNPFNNHDLYGSFSTPVTATVATNVQPSTYHPNLVSSTLPAFTASTSNAFSPTLSQPSTSYQWRTQQNYPASYQTYHLHHQQHQQSPQWTAEEQYDAEQQSSALHLPRATIIQTPNAKLSPTQSNDFTVLSTSSSSSSTTPSLSTKSTAQTPGRYKKRKNRTKTKRNRIVVI